LVFVNRHNELFLAAQLLIANVARGKGNAIFCCCCRTDCTRNRCVLDADSDQLRLVACNLRYGLGKSTFAKRLVKLPQPVRDSLSKWAALSGTGFQRECDRFFAAKYVLLDLNHLPEPGSYGIRSLEQGLAAVLWRALFGRIAGFDPVPLRPMWHHGSCSSIKVCCV
jgi:hypothetical protein